MGFGIALGLTIFALFQGQDWRFFDLNIIISAILFTGWGLHYHLTKIEERIAKRG